MRLGCIRSNNQNQLEIMQSKVKPMPKCSTRDYFNDTVFLCIFTHLMTRLNVRKQSEETLNTNRCFSAVRFYCEEWDTGTERERKKFLCKRFIFSIYFTNRSTNVHLDSRRHSSEVLYFEELQVMETMRSPVYLQRQGEEEREKSENSVRADRSKGRLVCSMETGLASDATGCSTALPPLFRQASVPEFSQGGD